MKTIDKKQIQSDILPDLKTNLDKSYFLGLITKDEYLIFCDQLDNMDLYLTSKN